MPKTVKTQSTGGPIDIAKGRSMLVKVLKAKLVLGSNVYLKGDVFNCRTQEALLLKQAGFIREATPGDKPTKADPKPSTGVSGIPAPPKVGTISGSGEPPKSTSQQQPPSVQHTSSVVTVGAEQASALPPVTPPVKETRQHVGAQDSALTLGKEGKEGKESKESKDKNKDKESSKTTAG